MPALLVLVLLAVLLEVPLLAVFTLPLFTLSAPRPVHGSLSGCGFLEVNPEEGRGNEILDVPGYTSKFLSRQSIETH